MRNRPSSRLLILDAKGRLLLFRFTHAKGALAGQDFWATPGGGLEPGETFEGAALRELKEETGMVRSDLGPSVARREFVLQLPDGEHVLADERFFVIRADDTLVARGGWSALELEVMTDHRWWSVDELQSADVQIWPENLAALVSSVMKAS